MDRRSFALRLAVLVVLGLTTMVGAAWLLGGPMGPVIHGACALPAGVETSQWPQLNVSAFSEGRQIRGVQQRDALEDFRFLADEAEIGVRVDSLRIEYLDIRFGVLATATVGVDHVIGDRPLDAGTVALVAVDSLATGSVVDDAGRAIQYADIELEVHDAERDYWRKSDEFTSDEQGHFRVASLTETAGRTRITVTAADHFGVTRELAEDSADLRIELTRQSQIVLSGEMFARLDPGLQVFVRGLGAFSEREMSFDTQINAEGWTRYSVEAGEWSIGLRTRGQGALIAELGRATLAPGGEVRVVVPLNPAPAELEYVDVRVVDADGEPLSSAWLRFHADTDAATWLEPKWQTAPGVYRLARMPDVPLEFDVTAEGFVEQRITDPPTEFEVRLTAKE